MLKADVLAAVEVVRSAIQDLKITGTLTKKTNGTHVPGQAPSPTTQTTTIDLVISQYKLKEIDGDRVKAGDYKAICLPTEPFDVDVNQFITAMGKTFRVLSCERIMAGNEVAASVLQLRV